MRTFALGAVGSSKSPFDLEGETKKFFTIVNTFADLLGTGALIAMGAIPCG